MNIRRPFTKKIFNNRGETLVETMVSVMIIALSVSLLLGTVTATVNINKKAEQTDQLFYQNISAAESKTNKLGIETATLPFQITGLILVNIPIDVYGGTGEGEIYSFSIRREEAEIGGMYDE